MLTKTEKEHILDVIGFSGWEIFLFDDFREIKDEKFHEIRRNFLKNIEDMKKYINGV